VGEQFAIAWKEIDRTVAATKRELTEFPEPFLLELGVELCCKILEFVTFFFSWYTQKGHKRFLASFNEGLSKSYQLILDEVRQISNFMQRGYQLCATRAGRYEGPSLEIFFKEVEKFQQKDRWSRNEEQWAIQHRVREEQNRIMRQETQAFLASMSQQLAEMCNQPCGKGIKQILSREADRFVATRNENRAIDAAASAPADLAQSSIKELEKSSVATCLTTKSQVEEASRILDPFFSYGHMHATSSQTSCFVETDVVQRMQTWNSETTSSILGIFGPATISQGCPARLLTSNYVQAANAAGIPCISFFCERTSDTPAANRAPQTIGTVAMLYALMKQLILYLPPEWATAIPITKDDFKGLDGKLKTWPLALSIFRKLLDLAEPPLLLVVIYGLQSLNHAATKPRLEAFLQVLRDAMSCDSAISGRSRTLKALLVTSGISEFLTAVLKVAEICDMNRGSAARSPGQARKGRQSMGGMTF
jgi:hypothetical protein